MARSSFPKHATALVLGVLTLAACATGPRPTLGAVVDRGKAIGRQGTGDAMVDKVLIPLESLDTETFTATYLVTPKAGGAPFEVVVAQMQPLARSVTMGDALFLKSGDAVTCVVSAGACTAGVDNSKAVPPLTGTFFDDDVKTLIRTALAGKTKAVFERSEQIIDQEALCITIPVKVDEDFCILPTGHLAKVENANVAVVLKALTPDADPARFNRSDGVVPPPPAA
jgi:hypothetical protein